MRSWFGRRVIESTGPAPGTPAAEIQARYLAATSAHDPSEHWAEVDRIVEAAKLAGFDEVVAAVDRYRSAATANTEPLERAVKSLTRSIYSLPFRPSVGSSESDLLNAWAAFDLASSHGEAEDAQALVVALNDAALAANARDVGMAVVAWLRGGSRHPNDAFRAISLSVYKAAYHRPPPPPHDSY